MTLSDFIATADGHGLAVEFGAGKFEKIAAVDAERRVGIEICEGYCADFAKPGVEIMIGDMRQYRRLLNGHLHCCPNTTSRVALFIDSLEHIEKHDGILILQRCQEDFDTILVFAPIGDVPQDEDVWGYGNEWQRHRSSWWPADVKRLGFDVAADETYHGDHGAMFGTWRRP